MRFISFRQYAMLVNAWKKERAYQKKVNPAPIPSPTFESIYGLIITALLIYVGYKSINYGSTLYDSPIFNYAFNIFGWALILNAILNFFGIKINK
jgi:hypothetical protein